MALHPPLTVQVDDYRRFQVVFETVGSRLKVTVFEESKMSSWWCVYAFTGYVVSDTTAQDAIEARWTLRRVHPFTGKRIARTLRRVHPFTGKRIARTAGV